MTERWHMFFSPPHNSQTPDRFFGEKVFSVPKNNHVLFCEPHHL